MKTCGDGGADVDFLRLCSLFFRWETVGLLSASFKRET